MSDTQSINNYVLGRGRLFFEQYPTPGVFAGTGEKYFGNTPTLETTQATTDLKHYSSETGLKIQDAAVTLQKDITVQFECDNIQAPVIALWFGSDIDAVQQVETSGSSLTETFTTYGGQYYQIGVTDGSPMGLTDIDPDNFSAAAVVEVAATGTVTFTAQPAVNDTVTINGVAITFVANGATGPEVNLGGNFGGTAQNLLAYVNANPGTLLVDASGAGAVITLTALTPGTGGNAITLAKSSANITISGATLAGGSAGTSEALVEGTDWNTDAAGGRFQIIEGGGVADGSTVVVTYKLGPAAVTITVSNEIDVYGKLRFVADNPVGQNQDTLWPYIILRSSGNLQFKGDTWQVMTFQAEVLKRPGQQRVYTRIRPGAQED